ncbi:MAG: hypothetical protein D3904_14650 [Candidatus Electrothrix sp. EH2]|nr:hypothetical protein [Candidatus Electrothrix sp. EH2]
MTDINFYCPTTRKTEQVRIETTLKSRLSRISQNAGQYTGNPVIRKRLMQCSGSEKCKTVLPADRCKHFNFA